MIIFEAMNTFITNTNNTDNIIGGTGAAALIMVMKVNTTLTKLDLICNDKTIKSTYAQYE